MFRHKTIWVAVAALAALGLYAWHLGGEFVAHPPAPAPTGAAGDGVTALACGIANAWAVAHSGGVLLVDAGGGAAELSTALEAAGIDPARVTHVLLTHSDRDHAGGLSLFAGGSVEAVMHGAEAAQVDGSTPRLFGLLANPPLPLSPRLIADGGTLEVGGRTVECLALPGHTTGHCAWLVDGNLLFTGDAVNLRGGRAVPFYRLFERDLPAADASRAKLAAFVKSRQPKRMFTGHSGYSNDPVGSFE